MTKRFSILLLLILIHGFLFSQDDRSMDRKKWQKIKESVRYGKAEKDGSGARWTYSDAEWKRLKEKKGERVVEKRRLKRNDYRPPRQNNSNPPSNIFSGELATFLYILMIALLLGIVAYFIIKNYSSNKKVEKVDFEEQLDRSPDQISITELQRLLQQALKDENYREAVRIYFIFILKELSERKLIQWKKDKTNLSYLREMRKNPHFKMFKTAVNIFDVVWYGSDHLQKETFDHFEPEFKKLHQKLNIK